MTTRYQLFAYWRSSASWRARIALAYKDIAYDIHPVNISPGADEQTHASYMSVNPMAQVPTLELPDGSRLTQSLAIIDYLETTHPTPRLFPQDALARAHAIQAAEVVNAGVQPLQNLKILGKVKQLGGDPNQWSRDAMQVGLESLEALARNNAGKYSVGNEISVADICLIPQLYNARRFELDIAKFSRLIEIEANCLQLDAFVITRPEAQPDAPQTAENTER